MTEPTTTVGRALLDGILDVLKAAQLNLWMATPKIRQSWADGIRAVEVEARQGYVPASLSHEWHYELSVSDAEGYARAIDDVTRVVEAIPFAEDYVPYLGRVPMLNRAAVFDAIEKLTTRKSNET